MPKGSLHLLDYKLSYKMVSAAAGDWYEKENYICIWGKGKNSSSI